jgi:hypothetical protein
MPAVEQRISNPVRTTNTQGEAVTDSIAKPADDPAQPGVEGVALAH